MLYSTSHYMASQHLPSILASLSSCTSCYYYLLIPVVMGQMPKLSIYETSLIALPCLALHISKNSFPSIAGQGFDIVVDDANMCCCHKPLLSPSTLLLFFSFSLPFFSIYSMGNSVTLCDIMRDKVTSRSHHGHGHMSHHRTCHT